MKMARVPLMLGPGHGRTYTMDLDALKLQRMFIWAEDAQPMYVKEDEDPIEAMQRTRKRYHSYERKVWVGVKTDEKEFVILQHCVDCQCQRG